MKRASVQTHTTGSPCIWIGVGLLIPFFFSIFNIVFGNFISYTIQQTGVVGKHKCCILLSIVGKKCKYKYNSSQGQRSKSNNQRSRSNMPTSIWLTKPSKAHLLSSDPQNYLFLLHDTAMLAMVLGVVILSVHLSHMLHALWQNQMMHCRYFDTTWKGNHTSFLTPTVVGRRRPLLLEI